MPVVNLTNAETNPTYVDGEGGGRRIATATETTPTYAEGEGGGRRIASMTENVPTYELTGDIIYPGGMVGLPPGAAELLLE